MKITIEIPNGALPKLQLMLDECGLRSLNELMRNGLALYIYLFRCLGQGKILAILNSDYEVHALLTKEKLLDLSFDESEDDDGDKNQKPEN